MGASHIVVVGAGLAGLTAAYRLQQAGASVQVLEAGSVAGGRVCALHRDGYLFDRGADALTDGYLNYFALAREMGLGDCLVPVNGKVGTVRNGRVIYMDAKSSLSMAFTPLLSWGAKWKLIRGMKPLQAMMTDLDNNHLHRKGAEDKDTESARDLGLKLFGKEVTDYLIDPMTHLFNAANAENTSTIDMISGFALAYAAPYCLKGGLELLPRTVAAKVAVRYGCTVDSVTEVDNKVTVSFRDEAGTARQLVADCCVIATLYHAAAAIYPKLANISGDYKAHLSHIKMLKMQLAYDHPTATDAYVIQVPPCEDDEMMGMFLDHNKCSDRAPAGHSLIAAYTSTLGTEKYLNCSDEELTAWARSRVEKLLPELSGHFRFSVVTRWPVMTQCSTPGYYRRAAEILKQLDDDDRIQIAGDMFTKGSQEAAVAWGNRAAENLMKI